MWIDSATGDGYVSDGTSGAASWNNVGPIQGPQGVQGIQGVHGVGINILTPVADNTARLALSGTWTITDAGKSVLQLDIGDFWTWDGTAWTDAGHLTGIQGIQGIAGTTGIAGTNGKSAFELAKLADPTLTNEAAWLISLKGIDGVIGSDGVDGKSAFEVAKFIDPTLVNEAVWLLSLKGADGIIGSNGADGKDGTGVTIKGSDSLANIQNKVGTAGDMWLDTATGHGWVSDGTSGVNSWTDVGSIQGPVGSIGPIGNSAYEDAVANGFVGNEAAWILSLKGIDGNSAFEVAKLADPTLTTEAGWLLTLKGTNGATGLNGADGKTAYEVAKLTDPTLINEAAWLLSLKGADGVVGTNGDSAFDIAVAGGFTGTKTQWLTSLIGATGINGSDGDSAFDIAVAGGFTADKAAWILGLHGADGTNGTGVTIKGSETHANILLKTGAAGDMWLDTVSGNGWVSDGAGSGAAHWTDVGPIKGPQGQTGQQGVQGIDGVGINVLLPVADTAARLALSTSWTATDAGKSLLQLDTGDFWSFDGTAWTDAGHLTGPQGIQGAVGNTGANGTNSTVVGPIGPDGKSAYEVAKDAGASNTGTAAAWIASLKGATGANGQDGADSTVAGPTGADSTVAGPAGKDGIDGADSVVPGPVGPVGPNGADSTVAGKDGVDGQDGADSTVVGPPGKDGIDGTQGIQGLQGVQAPVINNLTAGGTTSALAAEQGKVLKAITDTNNTKIVNFIAQKAAANGLATLDSNQKLTSSQLPKFAISEVYVVDDLAGRDSLDSGQATVNSGIHIGDIVVVTNIAQGSGLNVHETFMAKNDGATSSSQWVEISAPSVLPVKSDWNNTNNSSLAYIENRPVVVNNLNSTSSVDILAAGQGRVINGKITTLNSKVSTLESQVSTLETKVRNLEALVLTFMPKSGGTFTGDVTMAWRKKIILIP